MPTKLILLIDDEANLREVIQACLSDLGGWNVISVTSGEGLPRLKVQPDIIILNVLMPNMAEVAFIWKLRESPLVGSIPIMMLTTNTTGFTPQQLQQLGVVGIIAKPFNPVVLPAQVASVLGWVL